MCLPDVGRDRPRPYFGRGQFPPGSVLLTTSSLRTIAGDGLFGSVTSKLGGVGAFYTTKVGGLEMGLSISRMDNSS
jgi:hypothetical protein